MNEVSFQPNTCTHSEGAGAYAEAVWFCGNQTTNATCSDSFFCKWNGDVVDCPTSGGRPYPTSTTGSSGYNTYIQWFWDTKTCNWEQPVQPDNTTTNTCTHNHWHSTNRTMIDRCMNLTNENTCIYENCSWNAPKPLFTAQFCHPREVNENTTAAEWSQCVSRNVTSCSYGSSSTASYTNECVATNGSELIPNSSFCAIKYLTDDVSVIQSCMGVDEAACTGDCQWYPGKVVVGNHDVTFDNSKELFKWNFCHPPTTYKWEENAGACLYQSDG